ncbi:FkbM family methyltransferase [Amylibacter sp. IMCC11727]|uniref:FkbM family methyltransferase n=1 Tax=Amylibacter sp. IMCC11727 TaxID=3039851 RepID=UPI00244DB60A|nr:FkbM family methyltransferase [Amylibacter sp. IMCC11727]WGI20546.1 FkbM family methyltransferase [Amylibacter sp. IMCC11727]
MTPSEKIAKARKLLEEAGQELTAKLQSDRTRARGATVRELHSIGPLRGEVAQFFSQAGQDRIVDSALGHKTGGVFVDVGGYDGVTGSNSLFFEVFRGWSGILVEPAPTQLRKAEAVRRCPCLGYAVAGQAGSLEFMEVTKGYTQMSGFLDSYDPDLLARVRQDSRHEEVVHTLETKTLNDILAAQNIDKVDFLSLDVEGGEMSILSNFDFDAVDVEIWSVENNTQETAIPELMRDNGFDLIEFAGVDDIFRKRRET